MLDAFLDIFSAPAILYAAATGLAIGATVKLWLALKYGAFGQTVPKNSVAFAFALTGMGFVFFAGQVVQVWGQDQLVIRAAARFCLWTLFAFAGSAGLLITWHFATKKE